jgi:hypothetical protein
MLALLSIVYCYDNIRFDKIEGTMSKIDGKLDKKKTSLSRLRLINLMYAICYIAYNQVILTNTL